MHRLITILICAALIAGGYYAYTEYFQKSNAQKLAECNDNVGKLYGSAQHTISENGYSPTDQESSGASAPKDLAGCQQLYGK